MRRLAILIPLFLAVGCAHTAQYKPEYVREEIDRIQPTIQGTALVVTEPVDDAKLYSQHPSSWTGKTNTFNVKLGEFLRDITVAALSKKFEGGAKSSNAMPTDSNYRVVVKPRILNFDYRYNQLKNLGMAITPEAKIDISVAVYDSTSKKVMEKTYQSNEYVSGGGYVMSMQPAEKVNKAIHQTLYLLVWKMTKDIEEYLGAAQ